MDHEHWFDRLNKALAPATPRRTLLSAVGGFLASLVFGSGPAAEAAKKRKHKKKRKGKGKNKTKRKNKEKDKGQRRPRQCGPDVDNACETIFDTPEDVRFCKDKCERCGEAGTAFCIHDPDGEHPDDHATCCPHGETCCGHGGISKCCAPDQCCDLGGLKVCLDPGQTCCPADPARYCEQGATCCPGQGCFLLELGETCCQDDDEFGYCTPDESCCPGGGCLSASDCGEPYVLNPETCECECAEGYTDCDGACIAGPVCSVDCGGTCTGDGMHCCPSVIGPRCFNTNVHPIHCGGCDRPCTDPGMGCCDGACIDFMFNNEQCGAGCVQCGPGWECCHGFCIDPRVSQCCRDRPVGTPAWLTTCTGGLVCCTSDNGMPSCCEP